MHCLLRSPLSVGSGALVVSSEDVWEESLFSDLAKSAARGQAWGLRADFAFYLLVYCLMYTTESLKRVTQVISGGLLWSVISWTHFHRYLGSSVLRFSDIATVVSLLHSWSLWPLIWTLPFDSAWTFSVIPCFCLWPVCCWFCWPLYLQCTCWCWCRQSRFLCTLMWMCVCSAEVMPLGHPLSFLTGLGSSQSVRLSGYPPLMEIVNNLMVKKKPCKIS